MNKESRKQERKKFWRIDSQKDRKIDRKKGRMQDRRIDGK